ncbi:ammonium transporter [Tsukamurella paurometabola]|uniref:Ammonium transporter n=1 Tax=Tsukamurella paurometabola TaxID=2061 RepID=A0A3P8K455_TSUPA|nr:ammonium transporter [Tsukamurella paurometabola]UEA82725.1 ammonium transporter [Tsukamurella paurometabola]VDR39794.1 Ammonia transporter [Tsukamurella paurometabola]
MFPTTGAVDGADTAWLLAAFALVLLMTPGLALFYGGMVRSKSVLNMMMMCLTAIPVVWLLWVAFGYSLAFGPDRGGVVGDPTAFAGLRGLLGAFGADGADAGAVPLVGHVPALLFVAFQAGFAMVTVALIAGAVADRMRFVSWLVFAGLWATLVYFPVAHWVFSLPGLTAEHGGWIVQHLKAIDFAGGTAVEINSGASALVMALLLGRRAGWPRDPMRPHNLPFVMLGAGLLWFGWFGFNAGSTLAANGSAALIVVNTLGAGAVSMVSWLIVEKVRHGKPTSFGAASGVVAGLVAITPSCSAVTPIGALAVGAAAGAISSYAIELKYRWRYDDSLDVVGVHLVSGVVGMLMIGLVGSAAAPAGRDGLLYGGGVDQLWRQAVAVIAVLGYAMAVTLAIGLLLKATIGLRADPQHEADGLDDGLHAESAYDFHVVRGGRLEPGR